MTRRIAWVMIGLWIAPAAARAQDANRQLDSLAEAYFDELLPLNPVGATSIGVNRYNHLNIASFAQSVIEQTKAIDERYLRQLNTLSRDALDAEHRLTYDVFLHSLESAQRSRQFPGYLQPLNQFFSFASSFAQLGAGTGIHPFRTVKDYDDFLSRMRGFEQAVDTAIANMRRGVASGVIPAFTRLHDFVRDEYLPATRATVGLSGLPNGRAWYASLVRNSTTTDLTPERIHEIGLAEVARIHQEMERVKQQVGFAGTLQEFFRHLQGEPKFKFTSREEMLETYRAAQARGFTAYSEGWGLYAESLGRELGVYTDPYQYYGALAGELWRAIRLVLDTGIHDQDWTREQAIEYARRNSSESETTIVAEVERFIAIPSQALAYKIGQLKISELRERAERALGPRFDLKAFHRQVLESGALPLSVLEAKIDRWIAVS